jgi:hypothetical protein
LVYSGEKKEFGKAWSGLGMKQYMQKFHEQARAHESTARGLLVRRPIDTASSAM